MCVCVCVCVCICLRDGREGQGSRERQVASATRRGHDGEAHSAACAAAAPPAAPRRISALRESGCAAHSRRRRKILNSPTRGILLLDPDRATGFSMDVMCSEDTLRLGARPRSRTVRYIALFGALRSRFLAHIHVVHGTGSSLELFGALWSEN